MQLNALASEQAAIVGSIDPDANAAGALSTGWIPAKNFHHFMAVVMAGALGTSATLDGKLEQATNSSGAGVKDVSGKAITQLTDAGSDSDKQAVINLRPDELDVNNGFDHFRLTMTVATATSDSAAFVIGLNPTNGLASDYDEASVDEIVT